MNTKSQNGYTAVQKIKTKLNHPGSLIMFLITWLAAILTMAVIVFLVAYILIKGIPNIKPSLFAWEYNSDIEAATIAAKLYRMGYTVKEIKAYLIRVRKTGRW